MGLADNGIRILNFRIVNFRLLKELLDKVSWEEVLRDEGVEQSWLLFKDAFLWVQELSIPQNKKAGRGGRKQAWFGKDCLVILREKKGNYNGSKGVSPGLNTGVLSGHAEMGLGNPRYRRNWTCWGMLKTRTDSTSTRVRRDNQKGMNLLC